MASTTATNNNNTKSKQPKGLQQYVNNNCDPDVCAFIKLLVCFKCSASNAPEVEKYTTLLSTSYCQREYNYVEEEKKESAKKQQKQNANFDCFVFQTTIGITLNHTKHAHISNTCSFRSSSSSSWLRLTPNGFFSHNNNNKNNNNFS